MRELAEDDVRDDADVDVDEDTVERREELSQVLVCAYLRTRRPIVNNVFTMGILRPKIIVRGATPNKGCNPFLHLRWRTERDPNPTKEPSDPDARGRATDLPVLLFISFKCARYTYPPSLVVS